METTMSDSKQLYLINVQHYDRQKKEWHQQPTTSKLFDTDEQAKTFARERLKDQRTPNNFGGLVDFGPLPKYRVRVRKVAVLKDECN
jgi:hypothetical protein